MVGELPGLLHSHSGAVWGKKLIISGGMTEDEEIVGTVHLLCLEKVRRKLGDILTQTDCFFSS